MMNIVQKIAKKIPGKTMRGDFLAFVYIPLMLIVFGLVTAVLILGWLQAAPILSATANSIGLPLTGTAVAGAPGINQTTYLNIGNLLYTMPEYEVIIFYVALLSVGISTYFLAANTIGWLIAVILAPVLLWITTYIDNFAYQAFTQPVLANAIPYLAPVLTVLEQLGTIVFLFYLFYIILLSIRVFFSNPKGNSGGGDDANRRWAENEMSRGRG